MKLALIAVLLLCGHTLADSMLTGTWEDKEKGLKIVFKADDDGAPTGAVYKGGKEFKFDGFSMQETNGNAMLQGNFADGAGNTFPFQAQASNGKMTFTSGKTTYNLIKGGAAPANPAPKNPMDEDPPANPPANNKGNDTGKDTVRDGPPQNNPPQNGNAAGDYRDPKGLFSIKVPAGWNQEASKDGNSVTWKHPSGALVFVTTMANAPFQTGKDMYKNAMEPGLKQNGAKIIGEGDNQDCGGQAYMGQFERMRNGVEEFGECVCVIVKGNGVIFQFSEPHKLEEQLAPEIDLFWNTFKVSQ